MGGSLAKALRHHQLVKRIVACSTNQQELQIAKEEGVIDASVMQLSSAIQRSDIIIIASPLHTYPEILDNCRSYAKKNAIITDIGSVKLPFMALAQQQLPRSFRIVPVHPICGKETSGYQASDDHLYEKKSVIMCPFSGMSREAFSTIESMWRRLGANIIKMDAEAHDHCFAYVSHLVQIISYGLNHYLTNHTSSLEEMPESEQQLLIQTSRLRHSPTSLWTDIFSANWSYLESAITAFKDKMDWLQNHIQDEKHDHFLCERYRHLCNHYRLHYPKTTLFPDPLPKRAYGQEHKWVSYGLLTPFLLAGLLYELCMERGVLERAGPGFRSLTLPLCSDHLLTISRLSQHRECINASFSHYREALDFVISAVREKQLKQN